jgi:hypothetical protein
MKSPLRFIVLLLSIFVIAQRSPAPIVEEKPTRAPEQPAKPKPKRTTKPEANGNSKSATPRKATSPARNQPTPNPRPFAGTWVGKSTGATRITIVVSPAQDSAVAKGVGGIWGDRDGPATVQGNTLSWKFLAEKWVMVIAPDGKTAVVTDYGWPAGTFTGTFEKVP